MHFSIGSSCIGNADPIIDFAHVFQEIVNYLFRICLHTYKHIVNLIALVKVYPLSPSQPLAEVVLPREWDIVPRFNVPDFLPSPIMNKAKGYSATTVSTSAVRTEFIFTEALTWDAVAARTSTVEC